jgi:hypothetical protein
MKILSKPITRILYVNSSSHHLGNFKYGNIKNSATKEDVAETPVLTLDLSLITEDVQKETKSMSFYGIFSHFKSNFIVRDRNFVVFGNTKLVIRQLFGDVVQISASKLYNLWALSRFSKLKSVGVEITDIATLNLLDKGYLSFHGGCVASNGKGYIITGLPDMGKTLTTMKLLENEKISYLSEDILLIDEQLTAFGVPYTQTVEKRRKLSIFESVYAKIYEGLFKNNFIKTDIFEAIPGIRERTLDSTAIDTIFFLVRGPKYCKTVEGDAKEDLLRQTIQLNNLEFTYFRNEMILSYLFFNDSRDIDYFLQKEKKMITALFAKKTVVAVSAEDAFGYHDQIKSYIDDNK